MKQHNPWRDNTLAYEPHPELEQKMQQEILRSPGTFLNQFSSGSNPKFKTGDKVQVLNIPSGYPQSQHNGKIYTIAGEDTAGWELQELGPAIRFLESWLIPVWSNDEKTPTMKNTDNQECVWCHKPTQPLFNTQRYCPSCEGGPKKPKVPKITIDSWEQLEEITLGDIEIGDLIKLTEEQKDLAGIGVTQTEFSIVGITSWHSYIRLSLDCGLTYALIGTVRYPQIKRQRRKT